MPYWLPLSFMIIVLWLGVCLSPINGFANERIWEFTDRIPARLNDEAWVQPVSGQRLILHEDALHAALENVPREFASAATSSRFVMSLPGPKGKLERFEIVETEVMHPDLAIKFPEIRTFSGIGLDDPHASLRMDITPQGLHAQVFSPHGAYYIDPYWKKDKTFYTCYHKEALLQKIFSCGVLERGNLRTIADRPGGADLTTGATLKTYRLAVTAQGEYTQFHGGTVAGAMAAIVTTINRVNGIFENDLAVRLQLVANNDLIIYTNPTTDPFSRNDSSELTLDENQLTVDSVIGSGNYDIGHVFNTGGGGRAGVGVVCFFFQKAAGATGLSVPQGDPFDVNFVAHELGHQFGADHSFNGINSNCSGSRNGSTAYEIGSGSTIMAYAGICGLDNVQQNSDAYFHAGSLEQIFAYLNTESCEVASSTGNQPPHVDAGLDYTIPKGTPFQLTASGADVDEDTLTYCWEEMDLGPAQALNTPDNGSSPLFRSFPPTTVPSRTLPRLADLLSNTSTDAEKLPNFGRTMTWRVTARDNRLNGGGTDSDETQITVAAGAGPFLVTFPNGAATLLGNQVVTWAPANTQLAPVSAVNVNILLSLNGGLTFDIPLAMNTPNDGLELVTLPSTSSAEARIKIESADNIFFDVSDVDFTITSSPGVPSLVDGGNHSVLDGSGNGNGNGRIDPGERSIQLFLNLNNDSAFSASGVSAVLSSLTPEVSVDVDTATYPNLAGGETELNLTAYTIAVDPSHPCGAPISLRMIVTANEGAGLVDISIPTGFVLPPVTVSYSVSAAILDDGSIDIPFSVTSMGSIFDLDFSFDGSVCSTDAGSALVGLNHDWVGDLVVTLVSPSGRSVVMMDRAGGGDVGSGGHNFCQTLLNDDGVFPSIQSIASDGLDAPHTGVWHPANPLSEFDGDQANGNWILRVQDAAFFDAGRVNAFSLILTLAECSPPLTTPHFTITASSGVNGTMAPLGAVRVASGSDPSFQIDAGLYYHILEVRTNGTPIGETFGPGVTNFNYVWNNVVADGTVDASFAVNLAANNTPEWWLAMFGLTNDDFDVEALADQDGDGMVSWREYKSGTIPTNKTSVFRVVDSEVKLAFGEVRIEVSTAPNKRYQIEFLDGDLTNETGWAAFGDLSNGVGTWLEPSAVEAVHTFVDDFSAATSGSPPVDGRFYRVFTFLE